MSAEGNKLAKGSQVEQVFAQLLNMVIDGTYPEKARLPAERALCEELDTSRGTLREALRRMADWGIIESRQGSGMVVCLQKDWPFEVLPAYLRYSAGTMAPDQIMPMMKELLALQTDVIVMAMRFAARQAKPENLGLAREMAQKSWDVRQDPHAFALAEFDFIRALIAAGDFLPAQWLMNRLGGIFLESSLSFVHLAPPMPEEYLTYMETLLTLVARNDEDAAAKLVREQLSFMNGQVLTALADFFNSTDYPTENRGDAQ
ncbi:MAG: FadR/GntR family transcriptional regulator [Alphaproteobacteria bacterium]